MIVRTLIACLTIVILITVGCTGLTTVRGCGMERYVTARAELLSSLVWANVQSEVLIKRWPHAFFNDTVEDVATGRQAAHLVRIDRAVTGLCYCCESLIFQRDASGVESLHAYVLHYAYNSYEGALSGARRIADKIGIPNIDPNVLVDDGRPQTTWIDSKTNSLNSLEMKIIRHNNIVILYMYWARSPASSEDRSGEATSTISDQSYRN